MTELYNHSIDSNKPQFSAYNDNYFTELVRTHLENANNSDEFYAKLIELKNEQKKTLLFMQDLYNQKQTLKQEIEKSEHNLNDLKSATYPIRTEDYKYRLNTISAYETNPSHESYDHQNYQKEMNQLDIVSKPPPAPSRSTVTFQNNLDIIDHSPKTSAKLIENLDDDLSRIERMWDDFKINDSDINMKSIEFNEKFVKKHKKPANSTKKNSSRKQVQQVEWMPRLTVPEPFSMTIREQIKTDKKQEKLLKEMQEEREKRVEAELRETKRKFKANPVPAHVILPLYEKKLVDEELRKHKIKRMSKEYLEKVSKPFNLTDNKKTSNRQRRHSLSYEDEEKNRKAEFNAQPLPEFYNNEDIISEQMKENELYKQINKQMRSLELLKKSKLPHNMEMQEAKKLLEIERNQMFVNEINRLQKEIDIKESKINKRKTHEIPDYDELYKKFTIELENKKNQNRKHIKTAPFVLRAASRNRKSIDQSNQSDIKLNRSSSSMSRLNKSLSQSMDAFPIKSTELHRLRESMNKGKMDDIIKKELQQEHIEKIKKIKMKKLHDQIQEKAHYDPTEVNKSIERQTRKLKLEEKKKEEDYEQKLLDLSRKIETRKLQIEQVDEVIIEKLSLENIRRTLEKKYSETLKRAGIDEHDLRRNNYTGQVAKSVSHTTNDDWINE